MAVRDCCPRSFVSNIQVPSSPDNVCECMPVPYICVCEWKYNIYDTWDCPISTWKYLALFAVSLMLLCSTVLLQQNWKTFLHPPHTCSLVCLKYEMWLRFEGKIWNSGKKYALVQLSSISDFAVPVCWSNDLEINVSESCPIHSLSLLENGRNNESLTWCQLTV